jgi:hypothetical protein
MKWLDRLANLSNAGSELMQKNGCSLRVFLSYDNSLYRTSEVVQRSAHENR